MVGDNHTWLANRSAQCVKKGGGAASKPGLLQLWAPHCPKVERAWGGSCFRSAAQLGRWRACVSFWVCLRARETCMRIPICVCVFLHENACNVTTQMLYPLGSGAHRIYRAALQRLALHFQTSNFFFLSNVVLIKTSPPEETPGTHHCKPNPAVKCLPASCLAEQSQN